MLQLVLRFKGYKNMVSVQSVQEAAQRFGRVLRNHGFGEQHMLQDCGNVLVDGQVVARIESTGDIKVVA